MSTSGGWSSHQSQKYGCLLLLLHTLFKDASPDNYVKVDFHGGRQYKNTTKTKRKRKHKKKGDATKYINYIHYQN